ncbi:MAG: adenosylmethionine decarboxylase [Methylococcales bacterium]|nr:adenosylmethionine decarboxylase [Methylococcales bacterium]
MESKVIEPKGKHLIIDLYHAHHLDDVELVKKAIHHIISATKTTLLSENFHRFQPSGVTGIACLAESHISVHTWPEHGFAAFDLFMCGDSEPERAIKILKHYFGGIEKITVLRRGFDD